MSAAWREHPSSPPSTSSKLLEAEMTRINHGLAVAFLAVLLAMLPGMIR